MRRGYAVAVALLALVGSSPAAAYSRFQTSAGRPLYWKSSCVVVTVYLEGFSRLTEAQVLKSVAAAAQAWSPDAVACGDASPGAHPYVEIVPVLAPAGETPPSVEEGDARSTLIFRTQNWTRSGKADGEPLVSSGAALTIVHPSPEGHIVDADVLVNAVDKEWVNLDPGVVTPGSPKEDRIFLDLQNTLTHEFGHLLGLEHSCFRPSASDPAVNAFGKARWSDDRGQPVPDCEGAPPAVRQSVMFDGQEREEVSKRTLSPDEVAAMCTIYPADGAREACALDAAPGCSVVGPERSGADAPVAVVALGAAAIAALGARRRFSARGRGRA